MGRTPDNRTPGIGGTPDDKGDQEPVLDSENERRVQAALAQIGRVDSVFATSGIPITQIRIDPEGSALHWNVSRVLGDGYIEGTQTLLVNKVANGTEDNPFDNGGRGDIQGGLSIVIFPKPNRVAFVGITNLDDFEEPGFKPTTLGSVHSTQGNDLFETAISKTARVLDGLGFPPAKDKAVNLSPDDADGIVTARAGIKA